MRPIALLLIYICIAVAIRIKTVQVPADHVSERDIEANDGFEMKHAFVHYLKEVEVYRYDFDSSDVNHSKRDFIKWENQREKLQTLTKIMVMQNPKFSSSSISI